MILILFLFRWCSYNNIAVFKDFQINDIDHVESRLKSELAAQFSADVDEEDKVHFFGRFYKNPENFKFNLGERRLIEIFGKHLRELAAQPNGLNHFKVNNVNIKKHDRNRIQFVDDDLIETSIGVVFRKLPAATDGFSIDVDGTVNISKILPKMNDIKESLFIKVREYYAKFTNNLKKSEFTMNSVIVAMKNNRIDASVVCIFCESSENRDIKVFCRRINGMKSQWVLSNLTKHEERFHQIGSNQKAKALLKKKPKVANHDGNDDEAKQLLKIEESPDKKQITINDLSMNLNFDPLNGHLANSSSNGNTNIEMTKSESFSNTKNESFVNIPTESAQLFSTPKPEISNDALDNNIKRYQDILYTSVYSQILRMENCVVMHEEYTKEIIVSKLPDKKTKSLVKVIDISTDGNCLFYALTHQLFYVKNNSKQHIELACKLRKQVVEYVCGNIDPFLYDLKDRLIESRLEWKGDLKAHCLKFVKEQLSQNGFWGGEETLRATAAIFKANILLILDYETCILGNRFDPAYDRALVLCYVSSNNTTNKLNHFESVCGMSEEFLINYVVKVMELEKSNIIFQKEILENNIFTVE